MHKFVEVPEFDKDLRKLKKFRTIHDDLELFKKVLDIDPKNFRGAVVIPKIGGGFLPVYKAKKFWCKDLQSKNKIRVIYTCNTSTNEIILIEIYFKGQKEDHDIHRIRRYAIKINKK